jgi:hypothetical protein
VDISGVIATPVDVLATFVPPMAAGGKQGVPVVGLRYEMRSFVLVCKVLSSQTLRGVIAVSLCRTWSSGGTGTKFCSAFCTRSCGRRQRASAGEAGRGAARAKTEPPGPARRPACVRDSSGWKKEFVGSSSQNGE